MFGRYDGLLSLEFADDQALSGRDKGDLEYMTHKLTETPNK